MIHLGDCLDVMRTMKPESFDSVVTDPPYGIGFMGKAWDGKDIEARMENRRRMPSKDPTSALSGGHNSAAAAAGAYDLSPRGMRAFQDFTRDWTTEALRVLKPGGHMVVFASPRTYHRMVCGAEEAGFEVRDTLMWIFGSGFPKSHNGEWGGTALKPGFEPILLARKPLIGTVAVNHALHGTGGLNIDGCRIEGAKPMTTRGAGGQNGAYSPLGAQGRIEDDGLGRWPANVLHDGSVEVVKLFPREAGASAPVRGTEASDVTSGVYGQRERVPGAFHSDSGSAARFFYCAKASREDRNDGLHDPGAQFKAGSTPRDFERVEAAKRGNHHPTVKPTDLMRWLCRLVTPAGGLILDPFMGSGSTGRAAIAEGMRFEGIELDPAYVAIADARIRAMQPGLSLAVPA